MPAPEATDWAGGRVIVERESGGWGLTHEPAAGGVFGFGWNQHKSRAITEAEKRAARFGAKVFVEVPPIGESSV